MNRELGFGPSNERYMSRGVTRLKTRPIVDNGFQSQPRRKAINVTAGRAGSWSVIDLANRIEPDKDLVMEWYRTDNILSIGNHTASQLVTMGYAALVIDFLTSVECAEIDKNGRFISP